MRPDGDVPTAWERSMHPQPSVPSGLAHFAAELFGSLFVVASTFALIASVVLVGGGTQRGIGDRLVGVAIAVVALPVFLFGRYLISQHSVSWRRPHDDDDGGGPPRPPASPPPIGPSIRERHVAAGRSPLARPPSPVVRRAGTGRRASSGAPHSH